MNNNLEKFKNKNNINKENKIDFFQRKENAICSLFEVEHFLCDCKKIFKAIKLYKILK